MVSPDSQAIACPLSGRNSTYRPVQISGTGSNVTFEIGYAIAKSKRLLVTRNSSITRDPLIDLVGIFDTLGYKEYANDEELYSIIVNASSNDPLPINYPLNRRAPVYIVETPRRDQLTTTLVSKIKKARLKYRSFIAIEDTRMAAEDAIKNVASSFGVAIPLLSKEMEDAEVHNIRAAFVSGLAIGLGLPTLIVQHLKGPIPLDVRDFATTIKHPDDIVEAVNGFALDVTDKLQSFELEVQEEPGSLKSLSVGDPKAEDEFETLEDYFLQTDQYLKAERGEVSLIVGRKGTGKTAIFGHLRNRKRADSLNVVLDLKPEGYQLVKLREQILKVRPKPFFLSAGAPSFETLSAGGRPTLADWTSGIFSRFISPYPYGRRPAFSPSRYAPRTAPPVRTSNRQVAAALSQGRAHPHGGWSLAVSRSHPHDE
jgi:hypothetical protein